MSFGAPTPSGGGGSTPGPAFPGYAPAPNRTARPRLRTVIVVGLVATGFLLSAAVLAVEFETGLGVQVTLLAALFAALPLLVVVPTFLWLDRYEAEPTRMLILAFAWGAVCAPAGALFLNTGIAIAMRLAGAEDPDVETAVFGAPFVEEGLKGLGVLLIVLLRRREFDGVVDGIVYAGLVGAGFAFSENIIYLGREFVEYGQQGLTELFILRCIMGPFAHPLFTAFTGIGLGLAVAVMRSAWSRVLVALGGFLLAALLHGIWNLSAATGHLIGAYVLFQVPLFLSFVALVIGLRYREGRLIRTYLSQYADAGWLSHQEVAMLSSLPARRQARIWANQQGGRAAVASMRAFQDGASDLALLRARMVRGSAERDAAARERTLLESIVAHRRAFVGNLAY
ncbi:MAG TPA: PrsW family intramembrane metalloprotease [Lapillicoccus sp.]|uniref:PrsW family intramembrane metalloprotease n=1 Tax=Lapillicoccus sp. TaxID=1909287 RepID=UPI002F924A1F